MAFIVIDITVRPSGRLPAVPPGSRAVRLHRRVGVLHPAGLPEPAPPAAPSYDRATAGNRRVTGRRGWLFRPDRETMGPGLPGGNGRWPSGQSGGAWMPEPYNAQDPGPKTSGAAALAGPPASPAGRHRSRAMKIITPLVLFGLGVVLLVLAVGLYRSAATTEVPEPAVPYLGFDSFLPLAEIDFVVTRASSDRTLVEIRMQRGPQRPTQRTVTVVLVLSTSHQLVKKVTFGHSLFAPRIVHFTVNVADFGMSFNGTTASAAIPKISFLGPGTPQVGVKYPIPSASSYDWSSFPTTTVTSSYAVWTTATVPSAIGEQKAASTPGQVVVGINHARQATESDKTFAAGALLGLAGGAILSAVQEALHARD